MTDTLNVVQSTAGVASAICAGVCLGLYALTRRSWSRSGHLLGTYSGAVLGYGLIDVYLAQRCKTGGTAWQWEIWLFNFLQKTCSFLVLYQLLVLATRYTISWHRRWLSWVLLACVSAALSLVTHPVAFDQLCHVSPGIVMQATTVIWSTCLFVIMASITAWALQFRSRSTSEEQLVEDPADGSSGALYHPRGVMKTMCVAQGLRALMQVVNSSSELASHDRGGVYGGRVQILIIEQVLEVGQGMLLLAALLLQEGSAILLKGAIETLSRPFVRCAWLRDRGTDTMDIQEEPVVIFPELAFARSFTPNPVRSRQTTEEA